MQILQQEDQGRRLALGHEEVFPRAAHLVAHQHRVAARGPQLHAVRGVEGHPRELAEEERHPLLLLARQVAPGPRPELLPPELQRLPLREAHFPAEHLPEHPEGRPGAHRIALGRPHLGPLRRCPPSQLVPQPALADAGPADHQHRPGAGLRHALREHRLQHRDLVIPPHARRRLSQHPPRPGAHVPLPREHQPRSAAGHLEPGPHEPRGELVDRDARLVAPGERHPLLQHLSALGAQRRPTPPRHHRHRRPRHERAHRQRAPRGPRRLVRRRAPTPQRHQEHRGMDPVHPPLEPRGHALQRLRPRDPRPSAWCSAASSAP